MRLRLLKSYDNMNTW